MNKNLLELLFAAAVLWPSFTAGQDLDSRLVAYVGNWQECPTEAQVAQYTHIIIAFAVSYQYSPGKNICNQECDISTPPVCGNSGNNNGLVQQWQNAGKKVILSFGGAGMGGSWDGNDDCWEYCFGRETQVVNQLTKIVDDMNLDGVDLDYEYFYENNENFGFTKGAEAQNFLRLVTLGLRDSLPAGSIVTHAPMDTDIMPETAYFDILKETAHSLDFIMPQYYNGATRPAIDGIDGAGFGSISALEHYSTLVIDMFGGDATRIIFGFCISDCSVTSSNVNAQQAAQVMIDLARYYECNGGAFFWVALHDANGGWSNTVRSAIEQNERCSASPTSPPPSPVTPTPPTVRPTSAPSPSCLPEWAACTNNSNGCCSGFVCNELNPWYRQCQKPTDVPPTNPPTNPPFTPGGSCGVDTDECTNDINSCCADHECIGNEYYKACQVKGGHTCLARWIACTDDDGGCCDGLICEGNEYYKQCKKVPQ